MWLINTLKNSFGIIDKIALIEHACVLFSCMDLRIMKNIGAKCFKKLREIKGEHALETSYAVWEYN